MVEAEGAAVTAGMVEREEEGRKGGLWAEGNKWNFFSRPQRGATLKRSGID